MRGNAVGGAGGTGGQWRVRLVGRRWVRPVAHLTFPVTFSVTFPVTFSVTFSVTFPVTFSREWHAHATCVIQSKHAPAPEHFIQYGVV